VRFAEASFWEWKMSSQSTTHLPQGTIPRGDGRSGTPEQSVVFIAFAKLVFLAAALTILTPAWLDLVAHFASESSPQTSGMLRVVSFAGSAGFLAGVAIFLRVWTGLLKHLATA
jgi:hypothetical protein